MPKVIPLHHTQCQVYRNCIPRGTILPAKRVQHMEIGGTMREIFSSAYWIMSHERRRRRGTQFDCQIPRLTSTLTLFVPSIYTTFRQSRTHM